MKRFTTYFLTVLFVFSLLLPQVLKAQNDVDNVKKNLPKMLGATNVGKEFWFTIPPCFEDESSGDPNFIRIFVTSPVRTLVTVECEGKGYFQAQNTIANDVIMFTITPVQGQPYMKGGHDPNVVEQVFPGTGIHMYADQPIVVYCVVRYHYTSDGWLCIPTSSAGKEYIVSGYKVDAMFNAVWGYKLPGTCGIVAPYNDTKVSFTLGGNSFTKTAGGMKPGQSKSFTLQRGDVWMVSTNSDEADLSGSKVMASKPVQIVTGNQCTNIPTGNQWCDYCGEMDIPTYVWGTDLHVPQITKRRYPSLLRIFAKEPGTKLYRDNKQIGSLTTGGGVEGQGFLEQRIVGMDVKPRSAVFSGDKPIGIMLLNPGTQEDNNGGNSDPFFMVIQPLQQYQKEVTFCTPGLNGAFGFFENYCALVYETDEFNMMPADVEWAAVKGGVYTWKPLKSQFTGVDELFQPINGKTFAHKVIFLPGDGVYKIRAKKPFAAYSYGFGSYDSYGWPTSFQLVDLEKPDTVKPDPKWTLLCTGNVENGTVKDYPDDDAVRSNLAVLNMDQDLSFNYVFDYDAFIPGETRTTLWRLTIIDPEQDARAVITFSDRRGNDTTITINYYAIKLSIKPSPVDYGTMKLNSAKVTHTFTAKNESATGLVYVRDLKIKLGTQYFVLEPLKNHAPLPFWLQPQETFDFDVTFSPDLIGTFRDSIGIGDTCFFWNKAEIKAKVAEPVIDVTDINFGTVSLLAGAQTKPFSITNKGVTDLIITGFSGPALSIYTTDLNTYSVANPLVIGPGANHIFNVTFTPTAVGTFPDVITFFSNADKVDSLCIIQGQTTLPGLFTENCTWDTLRINRALFPRGPYPVPAGQKAIHLWNDGNEAVIINQANITNNKTNDANDFQFNRFAFNNMKIEAKGDTIIPVFFQPNAVGDYDISISFDNSLGKTVVCELKGWGKLPVIQTSDYNFGMTVIDDYTNIQTKRVSIQNKPYTWQDTVYIQDLVANPVGGIVEVQNGTNFGTEGFRYGKDTLLPTPKLILPGQSMDFDAEFVAAKLGNTKVSVTTKSEAEADVTSHWDGDGQKQSESATGNSAKICAYSTQKITAKIKNTGSGSITVGPLTWAASDLTITSTGIWNKPVTLGFGQDTTVEFLYAPQTVYHQKRVWLYIPTSILGKPMDSVAIDLESVHDTAWTQLNVLRPSTSRPWPSIGDVIPCDLVFNRFKGQDLSMAQVTELDVTVQYNSGILQYLKNSLKPPSTGNFSNYQITNIKDTVIKTTVIKNTNDTVLSYVGILSFKIVAPAATIFNADGEFALFSFSTFLPTSKDTIFGDTSRFVQQVVAVGNSCITMIDSVFDHVKLQPTCQYDLRWISYSGFSYNLAAINPNPISTNSANIDFAVGLDGYTEIGIYDSRGDLIAKPVNKDLKAGNYTVSVPVSDMSSGAYYVKMVSGPFIKTESMIIAK